MKGQVEILDCDDNITILAIQKELIADGDLYVSLIKRKLNSMTEALQYAKGNMALKEDKMNHKKHLEAPIR